MLEKGSQLIFMQSSKVGNLQGMGAEKTWLVGLTSVAPFTNLDYRKVSNIRRANSQNLNASGLIL